MTSAMPLLLALVAAAALPTGQSVPVVDVGEPLLLSPLIKAGKLQEARERAAVIGPNGEPMGESGFLTTDAEKSKHMFYWFFPAQSGDPGAPLVVWLQGGPGGSSLFGLFSEMGPFGLSDELQLVKRNSTWNKDYAMIFIDNPVGAGFSYTDQADGYCTDTKTCVASNLYSLLTQFYMLHENMGPLFITGESYGGHYVPGIGAYIVRENQKLRLEEGRMGGVHLPLAGIAVGDGWIDPVSNFRHSPSVLAERRRGT